MLTIVEPVDSRAKTWMQVGLSPEPILLPLDHAVAPHSREDKGPQALPRRSLQAREAKYNYSAKQNRIRPQEACKQSALRLRRNYFSLRSP